MKKYIWLTLLWVMIWFGFFLYKNPLLRWDIKADINGGYDVRWDVYFQVKNNTIDVVSNIDIVWDKIDFIIIYDPEKVKLDMDDINHDRISSNISKITINGPISANKFTKIVAIGYEWEKSKINISDMTVYHGADKTTLSITNIP